MADNPLYIGDTNCLKNLLGITDANELAKVEADITYRRAAILKSNPLPGEISYKYLKDVHKYLFDGIYEWAGKERTFQTQKGSSRFDFPNNIQKNADKYLTKLSAENHLKNLDRPEFIERAAYYFAELNAVHPFNEGNGRAQRVIFDKIAKDAGYKFNWNKVEKEKFIEAVIHGHNIDPSKLEDVFDQTLIELDRSIEVSKTPEIILTVTDPISKSEYTKALKALRDKASEIALPLRQDANLQIDVTQAKAERLDNNIQEHIEAKPTSKLLTDNSADEKLAEWDHRRKVLIAERDGIIRHIRNSRSGDIYKQTETEIKKTSDKFARKELPVQSKIVRDYEADRTIDQLSKKLLDINKIIDREIPNADNSKILPRSLKEKSNILSRLKNNKTLNGRISAASKKSLSLQSKETNLMLSRINARSLGRGR